MIRQSQPVRLSTPRRRRGGFLVWLARIGVVLLGLMLLGAIYESAAEVADARAYPPPGQMVDVGGYRLHINCTGTSAPTVVIDAGWGDWSEAWSSSVQPAVANSVRVCTYDRSGMGYSDVGPLPRSAEQFAQELHTLLHQGGVPGPYVLVGHSMGGLTMRVFAHQYASEVAGVVLIESMSPSGAKSTAQATAGTQPETSLQSSGNWLLTRLITLPARIGMLRLLSGPSNAYTAYSVTPRYIQTYFVDEGRGMAESMAQAGAAKSFGAVPLIVLSAGLTEGEPQGWETMQTELLQLSSNSHQLFADKSGHNIERDQPEAAVGAIVQMVEQVRHAVATRTE
jgi:pimeloyl-ACP methyl ester carboxylesterase